MLSPDGSIYPGSSLPLVDLSKKDGDDALTSSFIIIIIFSLIFFSFYFPLSRERFFLETTQTIPHFYWIFLFRIITGGATPR